MEDEDLKKLFNTLNRPKKFGNVKDTISIDFHNKKFVAVGGGIYWGNYKTFHDFLIYYLSKKLGQDWFYSEKLKKTEIHPIIDWYEKFKLYQNTLIPEDDGIYRSYPNGALSALTQLAYDIYILEHHMILQNNIIERLKKVDQFQGALHELRVTATFIRAGFKILLENEKDKTKNHPEFIAYHPKYNEKISVEAKSRHRDGLCCQERNFDQNLIKADITHLLNQALKKANEYPFIACIDLNLPPLNDQLLLSQLFKELNFSLERSEQLYKSKNEKYPLNLVVFTNYPHHNVNWDKIDPRKDYIFYFITDSKFKLKNYEIINDINLAYEQYNKIPNTFEE